MRALAIALLVAVGGCALTPAEVVEQGTRRAWTSALTPKAAAECIARNAENISGVITATVREGTGNTFETAVRQGEAGMTSLSRSSPGGAGATVETWISPYVLTQGRYLDAISKGC